MAEERESEDWKFDLEDVGEDDPDDAEAHEARHTASDRDAGGDDSGRATEVVRGAGADRPIEPGSPQVENVVFVLLGALAAVVLLFQFLSIAGF